VTVWLDEFSDDRETGKNYHNDADFGASSKIKLYSSTDHGVFVA